MESILIILALGAVVGWLAGLIVKGSGFGLIVNIVVGILGAFVGNYLFAQLGVTVGSGFAASIVSATVGAVVACRQLRHALHANAAKIETAEHFGGAVAVFVHVAVAPAAVGRAMEAGRAGRVAALLAGFPEGHAGRRANHL